MTFKVGDRVVLKEDYDAAKKGFKGRIVNINNPTEVAVELDKAHENGAFHNCNGKAEESRGYNIPMTFLEISIKKKGLNTSKNAYKPGQPIDDYVKILIKEETEKTRLKWLKTFQRCVLPENVKSLVEEAITIVLRADMFEKWGINETFEKGLTNSILLYGPSGTGKTMISESIAALLGKNLLVLSSGALQSNIPGQVERNIMENFQKAKDEDCVILIDECDSLLYERDAVGAVMAAEINCLLTEIERFDGVVILTTNRLNRLDGALQRRIVAKVELPLPNEEARSQIWKKLLPTKMPLGKDVDFKELSEVTLSGGDIKNAILLAARKAIAKNEDKVSMAHFRTAVLNIEEAKNDYADGRREYTTMTNEVIGKFKQPIKRSE